jgi:hypothetical protein
LLRRYEEDGLGVTVVAKGRVNLDAGRKDMVGGGLRKRVI